MAFSYHEIPLK